MKNIIDKHLELKYQMIIEEQDNGDVYIQIPDLPGCSVVEESFNKALKSIKIAKKEWIDTCVQVGKQIPLPSHENKYSGRILLRIPRSLHEDLVKSAKIEGVSLNHYMNYLLSTKIERHSVVYEINKIDFDAISKSTEQANTWNDDWPGLEVTGGTI